MFFTRTQRGGDSPGFPGDEEQAQEKQDQFGN